jgi:hypothetical protein
MIILEKRFNYRDKDITIVLFFIIKFQQKVEQLSKGYKPLESYLFIIYFILHRPISFLVEYLFLLELAVIFSAFIFRLFNSPRVTNPWRVHSKIKFIKR